MSLKHVVSKGRAKESESRRGDSERRSPYESQSQYGASQYGSGHGEMRYEEGDQDAYYDGQADSTYYDEGDHAYYDYASNSGSHGGSSH